MRRSRAGPSSPPTARDPTGERPHPSMTSRQASLRRRLDVLGLRAQARLDADWADRSLPWVVAGVMFAVLFAMSLAVVRQLDGGPGLAIWSQAAWEVQHGNSPVSSLAGVDPVAHQWAFVAYPLLWLSRWVPTVQLLAGTQALALSLAVVPIWRMARSVFDLRVGTTLAVVASYAFAPAVHAVNLSLFHPEVIAIPAFAWAGLYRRQSKWVFYFACIALMLVCRADLGITVAALGIVVVVDGDRWPGLATIGVGVGWTVAAMAILDPQAPSGTLTAGQAFVAQGSAPLAEARTLFSDPAQVLGHLTGQQSVVVIVALFAPLLFLGFAAPRTLIPAIPAFVLGIASGQVVQEAMEAGVPRGTLGAGRVLIATVPITVAGLVAISRVGHRSVTRVNVDHRMVAAIVIASLLLFVQYAPSSPYQQPWAWGGRDGTDAARMDAVDSLPDGLAVTVSPSMSALVAERRTVHEAWLGPPPNPQQWKPSTPAVLIDTTGESDTQAPLWDDDDRAAIETSLERQGYALISTGEGILVFRR